MVPEHAWLGNSLGQNCTSARACSSSSCGRCRVGSSRTRAHTWRTCPLFHVAVVALYVVDELASVQVGLGAFSAFMRPSRSSECVFKWFGMYTLDSILSQSLHFCFTFRLLPTMLTSLEQSWPFTWLSRPFCDRNPSGSFPGDTWRGNHYLQRDTFLSGDSDSPWIWRLRQNGHFSLEVKWVSEWRCKYFWF